MNTISSIIIHISLVLCICAPTHKAAGKENHNERTSQEIAADNVARAIDLVDAAVDNYFTGEDMALSRYYNPHTGIRSSESGSVWMYTSAIEAVNAALNGMVALKESGNPDIYNAYYTKYLNLLTKLYENIEYYCGTFTLTSYTQTREWSVYGVNRGSVMGSAEVDGIMNVYDDQQWLIRELLESYKLTGKDEYLAKAEYLTAYVLDGWDCTPDSNGQEFGGITWGPGYTTKHACSNGPMVSPLVWLYEIYEEKSDQITYMYIDNDRSRKSNTTTKSAYYLSFAEKIYQWQKSHLLRHDGVYYDMMGGGSGRKVQYEKVNNTKYRAHISLSHAVGTAYSYNCGTMLSGAADLYRVTRKKNYSDDLSALAANSFGYFARKGASRPDCYTYDISGFNNWFNGVMMRGWVDACNTGIDATEAVASFQANLDFGYSVFLYKSMLPTDISAGWSSDRNNNNIEAMFTFAYAAEYAVLARYELTKQSDK